MAGFVLGLAATALGSALVLLARKRVAIAAVDEDAINASWTAGFPRRLRLAIGLGSAGLSIAIAAVGWLLSRGDTMILALVVGPFIALASIGAERTYRSTPDGLEVRRSVSRQFLPWTHFDGFSVTDDAVVLHRPFPYLALRCSRVDILNEEGGCRHRGGAPRTARLIGLE